MRWVNIVTRQLAKNKLIRCQNGTALRRDIGKMARICYQNPRYLALYIKLDAAAVGVAWELDRLWPKD